MQQQIKYLLVAIVLFGMIGLKVPTFSLAEEDQDPTIEISGKIIAVNLKDSSIKIQYLEDEKSKTYRMSVFFVDDDSDMIRGEDPCELADLKVNEKVLIEYVHEASGKDMIVTLSVEGLTPSPTNL